MTVVVVVVLERVMMRTKGRTCLPLEMYFLEQYNMGGECFYIVKGMSGLAIRPVLQGPCGGIIC